MSTPSDACMGSDQVEIVCVLQAPLPRRQPVASPSFPPLPELQAQPQFPMLSTFLEYRQPTAPALLSLTCTCTSLGFPCLRCTVKGPHSRRLSC